MSELMTDAYIEQNKQLHADRPDYGASGARHAQMVISMMASLNIKTVLDYGCGKASLHAEVVKRTGFNPLIVWQNYDPAIHHHSGQPDPAELVVCTDVLEHVEPNCLDAVLDHIQSLAEKMVIFTVATRPAKKSLPDGRNAHLIVEAYTWWLPKIWDRWDLKNLVVEDGEFMLVGVAK